MPTHDATRCGIVETCQARASALGKEVAAQRRRRRLGAWAAHGRLATGEAPSEKENLYLVCHRYRCLLLLLLPLPLPLSWWWWWWLLVMLVVVAAAAATALVVTPPSTWYCHRSRRRR